MSQKLIIFLILSFLVIPRAEAQVTIYGGKGLLRIQDAEPLTAGRLVINPSYLGFYTSEGNSSAEDHNLNIGLSMGLSKKFELFAQLVPYQDDQKHVWGPVGDTRVGLKFHRPSPNRFFQWGILGFAKFPTAINHNVRFEPYSTNDPGWALMGLWNFDFKNTASAVPLKFSFNIGYMDHSWYDRYFSEKKDQLIGGFGFKFPIRSSILYSELSGELFINNTETVPMSYNSMRVTQGLRFVGPWDIVMDIAFDYGLNTKPTILEQSKHPEFIKRYADWKIVLGLSVRHTFFRVLTPEEKLIKQQKEEELRKMEAIRKKREKVSKELEEMREKLQEKKDPNE